MRHLLNTLFVTTESAYAALDGENIVLKDDNDILARFPLHILEGIFLFTYSGASPALMGKCAEKGINLVFCSPRGKFLARICGENNGNVLLRKKQYRISDDIDESGVIAQNFLFGKVGNCRIVIERVKRDHSLRIDTEKFSMASKELREIQETLMKETDLDSLRGLEGSAAKIYFSIFDDMIFRNKEDFFFVERSRRPPMDNVNAALSFVYTLLASECASALESVGLDSYVGFLHRDKPGRNSLALDLMEELRPCMADRFILKLINGGMLKNSHFVQQENGAVLLSEDGRKIIQKEWQNRKQKQITHPYLKEKIPWGLVPYSQALLLARYLRGDLDGYPPFLWR